MATCLDSINRDVPFMLDEEWLLERLHCSRAHLLFQRSIELYGQYVDAFAPACLLRVHEIGNRTSGSVEVGGCIFTSKVAAHQLQDVKQVFVYLATCGRSIGDLINLTADQLDRYLLDNLAYAAYLQAMQAVSHELQHRFGLKKYRILCPGSVPDWSVGQVKLLFRLLDGLYQQLDLRVLDSGMIDPIKSTAGLIYGTEDSFESCAICSRRICEGRRVPFDPLLHKSMTEL